MAFLTFGRRLNSTKYLLQAKNLNEYNQRCNQSSEIPPFIAPIFSYASDSIVTQSLQTGIEGFYKFKVL